MLVGAAAHGVLHHIIVLAVQAQRGNALLAGGQLQLIAEGGLLIAVPAAIAILAAVVLMTRYLRTDRTAMFWVRAGAISGIIAAAIQGIWDTGLRTPANGVLFAVIVAVAVHDPRPAPIRARARTGSRQRAITPSSRGTGSGEQAGA